MRALRGVIAVTTSLVVYPYMNSLLTSIKVGGKEKWSENFIQ